MITKEFRIIIERMEELCTLLLEQQGYIQFKQSIELFHADDQAVSQYGKFEELQQAIQLKEQLGVEIPATEREAYNLVERAIYANDTIRKFLYARNELNHLQRRLGEYVNVSIAQGRLPLPRELSKVSHGCGSHEVM
jgi:cell fate (sporulation/competence/biofilm development) regulator YlbF (YheA/YmcA/DUF963 family)